MSTPTPGSRAQPAPDRRPLRAGAIAGFGNVALHGHLPGWRQRTDFHIVAVSDPDPLRRALAAQALPALRTYADTDELLRHERLDFIDIASPPAFHAATILAAAHAGAHVLCEKPLATSLHDYQAIRTATAHAGRVLYTVHNWKFAEAFRVARQAVVEGRLGRLTAIRFETARNGCSVATDANWRVDPAIAGGGILVDHGWHAFYLLLALANERPARIRATLERRRYVDAGVEDTAWCRVEFPTLDGEIRLTWAASERRTRWELIGDAGQLTIDDDRVVEERNGSRQVMPLRTALSAGSHHPEWFGGVIDAFGQELDDPAMRGANQAEAELCLLLLTLAYTSSAQGSRPLDIPTDASGEGSVERA
jgi:predicted dehydrogenase